MPTQNKIELDRFLPYRLSVLSNRVSEAIARAYSKRFNLSITEWRVMAVLARHPGLSCSEVSERTAMDKVAVSRAVNTLLLSGRLLRDTHTVDRRKLVLTLSPTGYSIYDAVVPRAEAYERALLGCLDEHDREALDRVLQKLLAQQAAAADEL